MSRFREWWSEIGHDVALVAGILVAFFLLLGAFCQWCPLAPYIGRTLPQ